MACRCTMAGWIAQRPAGRVSHAAAICVLAQRWARQLAGFPSSCARLVRIRALSVPLPARAGRISAFGASGRTLHVPRRFRVTERRRGSGPRRGEEGARPCSVRKPCGAGPGACTMESPCPAGLSPLPFPPPPRHTQMERGRLLFSPLPRLMATGRGGGPVSASWEAAVGGAPINLRSDETKERRRTSSMWLSGHSSLFGPSGPPEAPVPVHTRPRGFQSLSSPRQKAV